MSLGISMEDLYSDHNSISYVMVLQRLIEQWGGSEFLAEHSVVDLGCGSGVILHQLKEHFPSTTMVGVDLDPSCKYKDVQYCTEDFFHCSLPVSSAAVVFSVNIGDYVIGIYAQQEMIRSGDRELMRRNQLCLYESIDRILMPGGVYVAIDIFSKQLKAQFLERGYREIIESKYFARDYAIQKPSANPKEDQISASL